MVTQAGNPGTSYEPLRKWSKNGGFKKQSKREPCPVGWDPSVTLTIFLVCVFVYMMVHVMNKRRRMLFNGHFQRGSSTSQGHPEQKFDWSIFVSSVKEISSFFEKTMWRIGNCASYYYGNNHSVWQTSKTERTWWKSSWPRVIFLCISRPWTLPSQQPGREETEYQKQGGRGSTHEAFRTGRGTFWS